MHIARSDLILITFIINELVGGGGRNNTNATVSLWIEFIYYPHLIG